MEFEGKVWKDGKFWLVEVPCLDIMTQGKTRKEALVMIKDAIVTLIACNFKESMIKKFDITVNDYKGKAIGITATNNKILLAFSLKRQRGKSGSTIRDASKRLGSTSPNAYGAYENGKTNISLDQYERLLNAINPHQHVQIRLVQSL